MLVFRFHIFNTLFIIFVVFQDQLIFRDLTTITIPYWRQPMLFVGCMIEDITVFPILQLSKHCKLKTWIECCLLCIRKSQLYIIMIQRKTKWKQESKKFSKKIKFCKFWEKEKCDILIFTYFLSAFAQDRMSDIVPLVFWRSPHLTHVNPLGFFRGKTRWAACLQSSRPRFICYISWCYDMIQWFEIVKAFLNAGFMPPQWKKCRRS